MTNQGVNRAQEEFDMIQNAKLKTAEDKLLKEKGIDPATLNEEDRKIALKEIGKRIENNPAAGSSRITQLDHVIGGIGDAFTDLGRAFGLGGNQASSASGFIDDKGNYHPRTCFTKGTLVIKLKIQYYDQARNGSLSPDKRYEEKVAIETIKAGDWVLSRDENSEMLLYKKVTELFRNEVEYLFKIKLSSGEEIKTTWNHPFMRMSKVERYTPNLAISLVGMIENEPDKKNLEWIEARDLRRGDNLINRNGKRVTIASIESMPVQKTIVYNFEVADTHVYLVGDGIWVHNYMVPNHENVSALAVAKYNKEAKEQGLPELSKGELKAIKDGVGWNDAPKGMIDLGLMDYGHKIGKFLHETMGFGADEFWMNNKESLTFRVHYGDLQYYHAMEPEEGVRPEFTKYKIIEQAETWYDEANKIKPDPDKLSWYAKAKAYLSAINPGSIEPFAKRYEGEIANAANQKMKEEKASIYGHILHMVQDSYSDGHIERDIDDFSYNNPKDQVGGYVNQFQSYSVQDRHRPHDGNLPLAIIEQFANSTVDSVNANNFDVVGGTNRSKRAVERSQGILQILYNSKLSDTQKREKYVEYMYYRVLPLNPNAKERKPSGASCETDSSCSGNFFQRRGYLENDKKK